MYSHLQERCNTLPECPSHLTTGSCSPGIKSITIPDGVNVTPVIGNITIPGGVSHCRVTCERQTSERMGLYSYTICPFPKCNQPPEVANAVFFPALPIEYETLSVNNWKFERIKRELNAEFSLEKHSNPKTQANTKDTQATHQQTSKTNATSSENSQNHVKQSETPRAPSQPLNASLPPCSNPPSHPCKVQMSCMSISALPCSGGSLTSGKSRRRLSW